MSTGMESHNTKSTARYRVGIGVIHNVLPRLCTQHAARFTGYPQALWITVLGLPENRSMVTVFPTYFHRLTVSFGTREIERTKWSSSPETLK